MTFPMDCQYTTSHEWVKKDTDGTFSIGITDHAQTTLGDIVFIELPEVGKQVTAGQAVAVVESVKAASDIYAPINGTIVAVNEALIDNCEQINKDAYNSWFFRLQAVDEKAVDHLLDADGYRQMIGN